MHPKGKASSSEKLWPSCLIAAILASCASATPTEPRSDAQSTLSAVAGLPGPFDTESLVDRLYPVKRFFSWTYAVTIKTPAATTEAQDVVRIESLTDGTGSRTGTMSIKRSVGGTQVFDGIGTLGVTKTELTITRDGISEVIPLPLGPGREWTSGTLKARSFKVPSLQFGEKVFEDVVAVTYSRSDEVVAVRWLAPRVGIVRQISRTRSDGVPIETLSELTRSRTVGVASVVISPTATLSLTPNATAEIHGVAVLEEAGQFSNEVLFSTDADTITKMSSPTVGPNGLKIVVTAVTPGTASLTVKSDQDPTKTAVLPVVVK